MKIAFDTNCPTFAALPWWKRQVERFTPIKFIRQRVFYVSGDWIICSLENHERIRKAGAFRLWEENERPLASEYPGVWN